MTPFLPSSLESKYICGIEVKVFLKLKNFYRQVKQKLSQTWEFAHPEDKSKMINDT